MARHFLISLTVAVLVGVTVVILAEAGVFSGLAGWWRARCVAEQLLRADAPPAAAWVRWISVLASGLMLAWIGSSGGQLVTKIAVCGASLLVWSFTSLTATVYGVFFDPFPALLAGGIAFLGGLGATGTAASRRRQEWSGALGDRVSAETFASLVAQPSGERPQSTVSELTALTVRITADWPTAAADAPLFAAALQATIGETTEFLRRQAGVVLDLPASDSVRGFFGWITAGADAGANEAAQAALALKAYLDERSSAGSGNGEKAVRFGIGLSTGRCLTGLHGTGEGQMTASGPPAEHSRQLAGAASRHGVPIAIGRRTCQAIGELFDTKPLENGAFFALEARRPTEPEPEPEAETENEPEDAIADAEPAADFLSPAVRSEEIVIPEAPLPPFPGPAPIEAVDARKLAETEAGGAAEAPQDAERSEVKTTPDFPAILPLEPVAEKLKRPGEKGAKSKTPTKPRGRKGK